MLKIHVQAKVNALREVQSASEGELRQLFRQTLMPSVLDRVFMGEVGLQRYRP